MLAAIPGVEINENNRKGTVMTRFFRQQQDKKHLEKALQIARAKSLEKVRRAIWMIAQIICSLFFFFLVQAISYLIGVGYISRDPEVIAKFIHREGSKMELETIGEYLGGTRFCLLCLCLCLCLLLFVVVCVCFVCCCLCLFCLLLFVVDVLVLFVVVCCLFVFVIVCC